MLVQIYYIISVCKLMIVLSDFKALIIYCYSKVASTIHGVQYHITGSIAGTSTVIVTQG